MNPSYVATARLLTQVAPVVFQSGVFALKGGTAINLFVREMPRLSVDLDLVLPDHTLARREALDRIDGALREAARQLTEKHGFTVRSSPAIDGSETKLFARKGRIEIKVEVNFVLRGVVGVVQRRSLTARAEEILEADVEVPVVSLEDLYAGKLMAALDRQHPRDLFDVMQLYEHEGITPAIRRAFVVYLASGDRPMHEILAPKMLDISQDYAGEFQGMTAEFISLDQLLDVRAHLVADVQRTLDENERQFLISLAHATPQWQLLGIQHAQQLPALRWKLMNLEKLATHNPNKFKQQARDLEELLVRTA